MPKTDPRVDAYIANAADFAQPILTHLRKLVHATCPDVEETVKWRMPSFMYHGILCGMAGFKRHCTFGFWHRAMRSDLIPGFKAPEGMGQFGTITSLKDLPSDAVIKKLIKQAMQLNASGIKLAAPKQKKKPPATPPDLTAALKRNALAHATWQKFSPSHKRDYIEWITEAKRPETREKRLLTTLEWLADGKSRNWKYEPA